MFAVGTARRYPDGMVGGRDEERQSRRRSLGALAIALALHALLGAFLLHEHLRPPEPPPPPATKPITIELATRRKPVRAPPALPPPVAVEPQEAVRASPRRHSEPPLAKLPPPGQTEQLAGVPSPAPIPAPAASGPGDSKLPPPGTGETALHEPGGGTPPGSINIWNVGPGGAGKGPSAPIEDEEGPVAEQRRVKGRIDHDVREFQARDRVEYSLIDPYFSHLRFGVHDAWNPTPGLMGGVDGADPLAGVSNLLNSWHAAGKQYASTGSPYADGDAPAGLDQSHPTERPAGGTSGFDGADFVGRWNAGELAFAGGMVVVELTQTAAGEPTRLRVLRSSGYKSFDESAKAAVTRVAKGALAPAHGLGLGGPIIQSVWKMEARIVPNTCTFAPDTTGGSGGVGIIPASIQCGGTFDLALGKFDAQPPLQTRVITKVELVAVYGGETSPLQVPAPH